MKCSSNHGLVALSRVLIFQALWFKMKEETYKGIWKKGEVQVNIGEGEGMLLYLKPVTREEWVCVRFCGYVYQCDLINIGREPLQVV